MIQRHFFLVTTELSSWVVQSAKHVPCATTKWAGLKTTGKKPARNNFFLLFLEQAPLTETAACTCMTSEDQRCLPCLFHILFGLFPFFDFILFLFPLSSFPENFFFLRLALASLFGWVFLCCQFWRSAVGECIFSSFLKIFGRFLANFYSV